MKHCNTHLKLLNNITEILQNEKEAWMDINVQDLYGLHLGNLEKSMTNRLDKGRFFFFRTISFVM